MSLNDWTTTYFDLKPLVKAADAIGIQVNAPVYHEGHLNIAPWNDRTETTKEDVINVFRKTAIRLREQVEPL